MQKLLGTGKVKSIGVSNFQITHLEKLLSDPSCKVVPAVNQIEVCVSLLPRHVTNPVYYWLAASTQPIVSQFSRRLQGCQC